MINDSTRLGDVTWGEFRAALDEMGYQIVRRSKTKGQRDYCVNMRTDVKAELEEIIEGNTAYLFHTYQENGRLRDKFRKLPLEKYIADLVVYIRVNELDTGHFTAVEDRGLSFLGEHIDRQIISGIFKKLYGKGVIVKEKDHVEIDWNLIFRIMANREEDGKDCGSTNASTIKDDSTEEDTHNATTTTTTTSEG